MIPMYIHYQVSKSHNMSMRKMRKIILKRVHNIIQMLLYYTQCEYLKQKTMYQRVICEDASLVIKTYWKTNRLMHHK